MKIREAIILAGGLGTRLREAVPDLPKAMAPVAGRPFLSYVIDTLRMQGIEHFIFSLGYGANAIRNYLEKEYASLSWSAVVEDLPLGTGGGIQLAMKTATAQQVLVANGDTLFRADLNTLGKLHQMTAAECTLALKPLQDFDRYGVVEVDEDHCIVSFREKRHYNKGLINGGVYLVDRATFLKRSLPEQFSFEKDYLEKYFPEQKFFGSIQEGYFIDIGIPSDFARAQEELKTRRLDLSAINNSWTLFLDRDGVINNEVQGDYILKREGFQFSEGVLEAFPLLTKHFGNIIVVSNQRGVGKGLMTEDDLLDIHAHMKAAVLEAGGRIDAIYYCTEVDETCLFRKPNPGMALKALSDWPTIRLHQSVMVGNKPSDMRFGRAAGMFTVFVATTNPHEPYPHPDVDLRYDNLLSFALSVDQAKK